MDADSKGAGGMGWDGMLGIGCSGWGSRFINRGVSLSLYQKDGKNSSLMEELGMAKREGEFKDSGSRITRIAE